MPGQPPVTPVRDPTQQMAFEADGQYTPTSRVRLVCRSDRQEPLGRVLSVQTILQRQFPPGEQEGALKNDLP